MSHHLGICLGEELITVLLQSLTDLQIVLDDTVMNHRNGLLAVKMWMGIGVVGFSMGRPTGVSDTNGSRHIRPIMGQLL